MNEEGVRSAHHACMHHGISVRCHPKLLPLMDLLGGGGGACDPGAQAVDRPQPGEEAGGVRARAQPTQALAFLLVSSSLLSSQCNMHVMCTHHVHIHPVPPHPFVTDGWISSPAGLASAKVKGGNRISRSWHSLSHTVRSSCPSPFQIFRNKGAGRDRDVHA